MRRLWLGLLLAAPLAGAAAEEPHPRDADGFLEGADAPRAQSRCFLFNDVQVLDIPRTDAVGDDILVSPAKDAACARDPQAWRVGAPDAAGYLLGKRGGVLLIDEGTGDARTLRLFDISTRAQTFASPYDAPIYLKGDTLTFWRPLDAKATPATCPNFAEITRKGLTPTRQEEARLDLAAPQKIRPTGAKRCVGAS